MRQRAARVSDQLIAGRPTRRESNVQAASRGREETNDGREGRKKQRVEDSLEQLRKRWQEEKEKDQM